MEEQNRLARLRDRRAYPAELVVGATLVRGIFESVGDVDAINQHIGSG
jgi:hypothetical protein